MHLTTLRFLPSLYWLPILGLLAQLGACASAVQKIDAFAEAHALQRVQRQGAGFAHVLFRKSGAGPDLHVYLEGDGAAWRNGLPSADPSAEPAMMLAAMVQDSVAAIWLGRPCYQGLAKRPPCQPLWWTHYRYSEAVVASLAAVIAAERAGRPVVLFGHSGGGTLAMLLASRLPNVRAVVTVAGNLDVAAWADYHAFSPLLGLDPAASEPPAVQQRHYAGMGDKQVPFHLTRALLQRWDRLDALRPIQGFTHQCCWAQQWQARLSELRAEGLIATSGQ